MTEEKRKRKNEDIPIWTWGRTLVVIALALIYGYIMFRVISGSPENSFSRIRQTPITTLTFMVIIPLIIGIFSSYTIPRPRRTNRNMGIVAISVGILFIVSTAMAYPSIILCGLIVAPLVLIAVAIELLMKAVKYIDGKPDRDKLKR